MPQLTFPSVDLQMCSHNICVRSPRNRMRKLAVPRYVGHMALGSDNVRTCHGDSHTLVTKFYNL